MKQSPIIFFGTSEFAVPILEALVKNDWPIVCVVTQPDKPAHRGLKMESSSVKIKAQELGLKVFQPKTLKSAEIIIELKNFGAAVAVLAAYGKIIPKSVIDIFPLGILNIHPSLLPKYRGPSPIETALLNGDEKTAVSLMLLDEEMDHGPILVQKTLKIDHKASRKTLAKELAILGANLLIELLPKYLAGQIRSQPQNHFQATYTELLTKENGRIDWKKPAEEIERMVRAFEAWPGAWFFWNKKRLKILEAAVSTALNPSGAPEVWPLEKSPTGSVWKNNQGQLLIKCRPGNLIVKKLQMEGKKIVSGEEFLRGYPHLVYANLN